MELTEKKMFSNAIGKKFDERGNPLSMPGNTFISNIHQDNPIYGHICEIINLLEKCSFYKKCIKLPSSSYHMTVIDGVVPKFNENVWTSKFSKDTQLTVIDRFFEHQFRLAGRMKRVRMTCDHIGYYNDSLRLVLKPFSHEDHDNLTRYRDLIADLCGLRFSNHNTYEFHISLAYGWKELNDQESQEYDVAVHKINEYIKISVDPFVISSAEFVCFNTMFEFKASRDDLE